jgi:hypothetical protein
MPSALSRSRRATRKGEERGAAHPHRVGGVALGAEVEHGHDMTKGGS